MTMKRWRLIKGGVRKYYNWGHVEIHGSLENCFTVEELIEVLETLVKLKALDVTHPKLDTAILKIKGRIKDLMIEEDQERREVGETEG